MCPTMTLPASVMAGSTITSARGSGSWRAAGKLAARRFSPAHQDCLSTRPPMPTYVALLRAINVSGQNVVPMPALRESLAGLGFNDVRTHLQSGNIVFDARRSDKEVIAAAIKIGIARHFRLDIPVLVMSARELRAIAGAN